MTLVPFMAHQENIVDVDTLGSVIQTKNKTHLGMTVNCWYECCLLAQFRDL